MTDLKVEWVFDGHIHTLKTDAYTLVESHAVPVVRLEALRAWLEAHQYPRQYGATAHNGVIDDLLDELRDLA